MPNYEFRCQSCSKQFFKSLPFGTKDMPSCPMCKGITKRLISPPMVHFKGSGFYKTDSAAKPTETTKNPVVTQPAPATPTPAAKASSPAPSTSS